MNTHAPEWWIRSLAQTVYGIRSNARGVTEATKWDEPGIRAAITKLLADGCSLVDTARVMCAGADNTKALTPAAVTKPGPQWDDTTKATTKAPTMCHEHKGTPRSKCDCNTKVPGSTKPANFHDLYAKARAEAASNYTNPQLVAQARDNAWRNHT